MAHKRPNVKRQRSARELPFLCGIMLAASAPLTLAQEAGESGATDIPVTGPGPGPRNLEAERSLGVETVETEQDDSAPELSTEALDEEALDDETIAAGQFALDAAARLEAQMMLTDLLEEELYDEAVVAAERVVELTEEEIGESLDLGIVLSNLAIVQRRAELFEESEANFVRAIEMIRSVDGNFSDAVINPLIGLGINYQQRGESMQAMAIFEEARTVNRRVHGLMNEEQIDILDHMSNVMIDMQRYAEADRLQVDALQLRERIYGAESMEILPAIYKFARWLRSAFRFQEERDQYSRAMGIIRDHGLESSPAMIRALQETGNSFRVQKYPEGRGISALRRALEIAESQEPPDDLTIAELLVDIGDWNTAFSKVGPTGDEYRRAWALLGGVRNGDEIRQRWFDEPNYVLRENPSNRGIHSSSEPGVLPGHVLVKFDVDASGRTTNVQVVESVPPGLKEDSTARAINRSRFRPRMVDGEIVASTGHARNFTFYYLPPNPDE